MQYEHIIKDERGTLRIVAKLIIFDRGTDKDGNPFRYDVMTFHTPKGKRKETYSEDIATVYEKEYATLKLWQLIKPQTV